MIRRFWTSSRSNFKKKEEEEARLEQIWQLSKEIQKVQLRR